MQMRIKRQGKEILTELGILLTANENEAIFLVDDNEIKINISLSQYNDLKNMITEDEHILLPIDMSNKCVILDADIPELSVEELQFDD